MYNWHISADPNKATQTYAQYTTHYNTVRLETITLISTRSCHTKQLQFRAKCSKLHQITPTQQQKYVCTKDNSTRF